MTCLYAVCMVTLSWNVAETCSRLALYITINLHIFM